MGYHRDNSGVNRKGAPEAGDRLNSMNKFIFFFSDFMFVMGDRGSTVVKMLCYKSERRWFDPSLCQWDFSLT